MPNALGWGAGIAGNVMTETDFAQSAAEMPLSASRVFYERSKIAATETPGLGTALTDDMIDPGRGSPVTDTIARLTPMGDIVSPLVRDFSANAIPNSWRESDADLRARGQEPLTKEQYDADPVPGVTWDARMTVARKQSLKDYHDWKDFKGRQIARSDHGIANFLGELAGSATDPINYIPVVGEAMKGAQVARWGLAKTMMMSAADAALNTALAGGATKSYRNSIGDETTWADIASQSAMAALVGGIFGAGSHGISHLLESRKANTLARVSDARAVLNEAVSHIAAGEDVNLSAGAKDILARADQDLSQIEIPKGLFETTKPDAAVEPLPVVGGIRRPQSLLNFLASSGLKDDSGELKAAGLGYMVRKDGIDLDAARERAVEAGYLQDNGGDGASTSTVRDLLDALQADQQARAAKDNASRIYSTKDEAQKGAFLDREKAAQSADEFEAKHGAFVEQAKAEGYDAQTTGDQSLMAMASDMHAAGKDLNDAIESAARQLEDWGPDPAAHLSDADLHAFTGYDPARAPRLDTTLPPDDFPHDAEFTAAAQSATKPSTIESMAKDYGIDTADMHLDYEVKQIEAEGRLGAGDTLRLEEAKATVERANAWGEALRAAATCVLGG